MQVSVVSLNAILPSLLAIIVKYGSPMFCCIKHYWNDYEQNNVVKSVRVDDWKADFAIIASNIFSTEEIYVK